MAKKPIPTDAKPQPATSLYLKAPRPIKPNPTITIIVVAQAKTVFLFIAIIIFFFQLRRILVKTQGTDFTPYHIFYNKLYAYSFNPLRKLKHKYRIF